MAREYYAQRQNPDGSVTRYRTEERYWQGRVSEVRGVVTKVLTLGISGMPREAQRVKFYSVGFTFSIL